MNLFTCKVYMFGDDRYITIETEHSKEELESNYSLLDNLVTKEVIDMINVQDYIE